jgi:hypothetical protein
MTFAMVGTLAPALIFTTIGTLALLPTSVMVSTAILALKAHTLDVNFASVRTTAPAPTFMRTLAVAPTSAKADTLILAQALTTLACTGNTGNC